MQRRLVLLVGYLAVTLGPLPAAAVVVNRVLATIDGEPVTLHEFNTFAERTQRRQTADPQGLLEGLITDKLLQKEVSDKGIVVRDEDIDHYVDGIKERNRLSDAQLQQALAAQGMTWEGYRKQIREEIQKAQLINREIRGKVNVTPEEVERYYKAHLEEYAKPERVHLRHIVLRLPAGASEDAVAAAIAKAEDLRSQIGKGTDFAELARQHSDDPAAKDGGDLGWLQRGQMLDVFETAALELKNGEVSRPVRTEAGVHLIKLEEREGASHTSLDELAGGIKEQLYNAALEERYEKWLTEELRKRHVVEIRP